MATDKPDLDPSAPSEDPADPVAAHTRDSGPQVSRAVRTKRLHLSLAGIATIGLAIGIGTLGGLGAFTFGYGEGLAYLSNDPAACTNCHVMQGHHDSWAQSSHRHVAVCNDCHLAPHPVGKWITKADNGFFHSLAFTTGGFHEPIQIKPRNSRVTQAACLSCHGEFVDHMRPALHGGDMLACVHCHSDVGHAHR